MNPRRDRSNSASETMSKRVLSVGNCVPDNRVIAAMIERQFQAELLSTESLVQTLALMRAQSFDLVLVNRVLDRDGSDGLEVVRRIKAAADLCDIPVMLITNFPEYQQRAEAAGALEGFGKQALHAPETLARLEPVLS